MMKQLLIVLVVGFLWTGCRGLDPWPSNDTDTEPDTETDTDTDEPVDTHSDVDTDTSTDTETVTDPVSPSAFILPGAGINAATGIVTSNKTRCLITVGAIPERGIGANQTTQVQIISGKGNQ